MSVEACKYIYLYIYIIDPVSRGLFNELQAILVRQTFNVSLLDVLTLLANKAQSDQRLYELIDRFGLRCPSRRHLRAEGGF